MAVVVATGVKGRLEVLGFDVIAAESEDGWVEFFKSLKEGGLHGVKLVISDAHPGALRTLTAQAAGYGQGFGGLQQYSIR